MLKITNQQRYRQRTSFNGSIVFIFIFRLTHRLLGIIIQITSQQDRHMARSRLLDIDKTIETRETEKQRN